MRILEHPQAGAAEAQNFAECPAVLYHSPDLVLSPFRTLLADLGFGCCPIDDPAQVDVSRPHVFLISVSTLRNARFSRAIADLHGDLASVLLVGKEDSPLGSPDAMELRELAFAWLDWPPPEVQLRYALKNCLREIRLHEEARKVQMSLDERTVQMADLHHVGIALSMEHDSDALQTLILTKARDLTGADAGSLYLVVEDEQPGPEVNGEQVLDANGAPLITRGKMLAFNKAQNYSNPTDFKAFRMRIDAGVAGYVASTGVVVQHEDVYELPEGAPYTFNVEFDQKTGYRTKSMLAVPMVNSNNEVIGVIQLINRKRRPETRLNLQNVEDEVVPFSLENRDLTLSFASQAAVALDNHRLINSIQALLEGFVTASVQAIESRDPTTSGHSGRVATLTVGLAEVVNSVGVGRFKDARFSEEDLREIRYASVLHDFGKVGVREHVLVKAKKLYDWQMEGIRSRFTVARSALESRCLKRKLEFLMAHGLERAAESLAAFDKEYATELAQLEAYFQLVKQVNEPTVLEDNAFDLLQTVASLTYTGAEGEALLVEPPELKKLSIKKGSLDEGERLEIESHVTHTYKFLTKIPWTKDLQRVPEIAWAHHEKLDGSGYPNRLTAEQIPLQSKMMTIADIYDALTAWDRPYKKAVPVDKALQILNWEVKDGHADAELLDLFIQKEVYKLVQSGQ